MKLRIGSYNLENLFSRPKLLNHENNDDGKDKLQALDKLRGLLARKTYTEAVKADILALNEQLKGDIEIVEQHGKLFSRQGFAIKGVKAEGVGDWLGFIQLQRDELDAEAVKNSARIVRSLNADILTTVEVEDRLTLRSYNSQRIKGGSFKGYPFVMVIDGNDQRGIDVGLLSRHPILNMSSHVDDEDKEGIIFSRDCLETHISLGKAGVVHVLSNHFKSQGYGKPAESDAKRRRQAVRVAEIVKGYNLKKDYVVVAGDFNDDPKSATLQPLLTLPGMFDALALRFPDEKDRWTYHYKKNEQIDYLLVSEALKKKFTDAGVLRAGMWDVEANTVSGEKRLAAIKEYKQAASDHAAIYADFDL